MSMCQPIEKSPAKGKKGSLVEPQNSITLSLPSEDPNGNAFPKSAFSSASSPFSQGGSSPDSLDSTSSVSSDHVNSSMEDDVIGGKMKMGSEVESSDSGTIIPYAVMTHDWSGSNDNSMSIYLDAPTNDGSWKDLSEVFQQCDNDSGVPDNHNEMPYGRRVSEDSPDSAATEALMCSSPENEFDDDDLFLSVSSREIVMERNSFSLKKTVWATHCPSEHSSALSEVKVLIEDPNQPVFSNSPENLVHAGEPEDTVEILTEICLLDLPKKEEKELKTEAPNGVPRSSNSEGRISVGGAPNCKPQTLTRVEESSQVLSFPSKESPSETQHLPPPVSSAQKKNDQPTGRTAVSVVTKPGKNGLKTFPKMDLKNVKSKIVSRPTPAPGKSSLTQAKIRAAHSRPSNAKKLSTATHEPAQNQQGDGSNGKSSTTPTKASGSKPHVSRTADPKPKAPVKGAKKTSSAGVCSELNSIGDHKKQAIVEEPGCASEDRQEKKVEGLEAAPASAPNNDCEGLAAASAVEKQTGEKPKSSKKNVSSRLRSKPGLPAAVLVQVSSSLASTTTAAQAQRPKPGGTGRDGRPSGTASPPRGRTIPTGAKTRMTERVTAASSDSPTTAPATSRHSQIPAGAAVARLPSGSKLPVKGLPTSLSSSSLGSIVSESNPAAKALGTKSEEKPSCAAPAVGSQVTGKPPTSRPTRIRNRATSFHEKSSSTVMKTPVMAGHALSKTTHSPLQRHGSARMIRPSAAVMGRGGRRLSHVDWSQAFGPPSQHLLVDKNKPKGSPAAAAASPRATSCQTSVQPGPATPQEEKPTVAAHHCLQCEKKGQCIQQLRKLLLSGTRRLEALALVVQHIFAEREEALKQKNELAVELTSLRKELGSFMSSYDRVEKEKEEVQERFEAVVQKLEEKHRAELTQLEERLRAFFTAEMDKNQQASEEEAEKYRALMQQEVEEVQSKQEALWREQEEGHNQQMEALKQQYKITMEEMKKTYEQEMQSLDQNLKELEVSHSEQMQQLTTENNVLNEKIKEEEQRRMLAAKSQKDALTSYLEQELESLKVVLDLKNQKLHQQEKKLMQMDKLIETNVKLEESLKKVQQENEDYRARMDKHAALTKQLSTEQAVLQQTLQMESKVNKRLSMENEELLWKLHNGDLSSPRRLSPTSPFSSPRNSASFSAAPLSPR